MSAFWSVDQLATAARHRLTAGDIPFTVVAGKSRSPVCLVMAGVHGDEYEGPAAIHDLCAELAPAAISGTVVFVPVANPRAFAAATRRHPDDDGDLNRAFPGNPDGGPTERLAHLLMQEFILGADCVLSLHGWSKEAMVMPYVECPEGEGSAAIRSRAAAQALGFEYVHPYAWPAGVLGWATVPHGIPTIECEIGGMGTTTTEGRAQYRDVILRFLAHFDVLCYDAPPAPQARLIGHTEVLAQHSGLFRSSRKLGESLHAGERFGDICSMSGERREPVCASADGFLGLLRTLASVRLGDLVAQIFWERYES